jgi:hypothetical protein
MVTYSPIAGTRARSEGGYFTETIVLDVCVGKQQLKYIGT